MKASHSNTNVWVLADRISADCLERLGDARRLADAMSSAVGVLWIQSRSDAGFAEATETDLTQSLIHGGGDLVLQAKFQSVSTGFVSAGTKASATIEALLPFHVRTVFAGGDPPAREWAALLAAKEDWSLISPALMVEYRRQSRVVTKLNHSGRKSCQVSVPDDVPVVLTLGAGVAEASPPDDRRTGEVESVSLNTPVVPVDSKIVPANTATCDIRDVKRLISGGRGLGSAEGFELLAELAKALDAGVAASRMAVDLGWVEQERQVGQTGKTVEPDVYIACGISGASHHLDGMSDSQHIIAINTDADAPIMKKADLGLVADLHPVLQEVKRRLESRTTQQQEAGL